MGNKDEEAVWDQRVEILKILGPGSMESTEVSGIQRCLIKDLY